MVLAEYSLSTKARAKDSPRFTLGVSLVIDELRKGIWDAQAYVYPETDSLIHIKTEEEVVVDSPEYAASDPNDAQTHALTWLRDLLGKQLGCTVEDVVLENTDWE